MIFNSHRYLACPPVEIHFTIVPSPTIVAPTLQIPWQRKLWNDLQQSNELNASASWMTRVEDFSRTKYRVVSREFKSVTVDEVFAFLRDIENLFKPIANYAEAATKLNDLGGKVIKLPDRSIFPVHITSHPDNRVSVSFDPQVDKAIETHPQEVRMVLQSFCLSNGGRSDLNPVYDLIRNQVSKWLELVPKKPVKNCGSSKAADPLLVEPKSRSTKNTNQRYFRALYLVAFAVAVISFIALNAYRSESKNLTPIAQTVHRLDSSEVFPATQFIRLISEVSPTERYVHLFHELYGKSERPETLPIVIRKFIDGVDPLRATSNLVLYNDLKHIEDILNRFKDPVANPIMDIEMARLVFFSDSKRSMDLDKWKIPESSTIIGVGTLGIPDTELIWLGQFSLDKTLTGEPSVNLIFTGELIDSDTISKVQNMPVQISNIFGRLAKGEDDRSGAIGSPRV